MGRFHVLVLALVLPVVSGLIAASQSCAAEDLAARVMFQNELASICLDMCRKVGMAEKGCSCPNFVDKSAANDGVQTWKETLEYMDNLVVGPRNYECQQEIVGVAAQNSNYESSSVKQSLHGRRSKRARCCSEQTS